MKTFYLLAIYLPLSFLSCSIDYENAMKEKLDESIPASQLYNVKRVQVQKGSPKITFEAKQGIVWKERQETELFSFKFYEYDNQQKVLSSGKAAYLLIKDNHDAWIKGDIKGYSSRGEASINTEALSWEDESRILKGNAENTVRLEKDDGSLLEGQGFSADLYTNTVSFSGGIHGKLKPEDKNLEEETAK